MSGNNNDDDDGDDGGGGGARVHAAILEYALLSISIFSSKKSCIYMYKYKKKVLNLFSQHQQQHANLKQILYDMTNIVFLALWFLFVWLFLVVVVVVGARVLSFN